MNRRLALAALAVCICARPARVLAQADAPSVGVLPRACRAALDKLGRTGGFLRNDLVRIAPHKNLAKASRILRALGHGGKLDALVIAMNHTAEQAISEVTDLLLEAAARVETEAPAPEARLPRLRESTQEALAQALPPAVRKAATPSGLDKAYSELAAILARLANIHSDQEEVERYVCEKMLLGIYTAIGAELDAPPTPIPAGAAHRTIPPPLPSQSL